MALMLRRRQAARLITLAVAAAAIGGPAWAGGSTGEDGDNGGPGLRQGKLFTITNAPAGNEVRVYARSDSGPARFVMAAATQGTGTGTGLGSQGAVTLSGDGRFLFVVNAASNTVSTFAVRNSALVLRSVVDSGGLTPTSVAEYGGLVYVLNAGGSGQVAGFRNLGGRLEPLEGSTRGLSAAGGTAPAQVAFDSEGEALVVSERATNLLSSWRVRRDGTLGAHAVTPTPGVTPYGFAVSSRNVLVLSEAVTGSVSSFVFAKHGGSPLQAVSAALATTQGAPCWVAVTPDGRYAYSSNAASSSISSLAIAKGGALTLLEAQAGLTGSNAGALDMAVSPDGRQLDVLAPRTSQIVSFTIAADGSLAPLGAVGGLPAGFAGLAAN